MSADTAEAVGTRDYETAEAIAPTWERRREDIEKASTPVREWMLDELSPREGDTVLELAAGTGDTGFQAARSVGERGRLITTDFSPSMLEAARRRGSRIGVANVEYRLVNAERIPLDDHSVDGVLCRFGYMLMSDPGAALSETRRVLRPGGRLALAVWGPPERNPFFGTIAIALVRHGHASPPQPPPTPGIFAMASSESMTALLRRAGFTDVRTEEVAVRFVLPDADEYLSLISDTAGQLALAMRKLTQAERSAIKSDVEDSLSRFVTGDGYELPGVALCAVAS